MITGVILMLLLYSVVLSMVTWNQLKRNEIMETALEDIYGQVSFVLQTMRELDEKQMFESDDEVGSVFAQLTELVYSLQEVLGEGIDDIQETED